MRASLLALVTILVVSPAAGQSNQVRRGPAPSWAKLSALAPLPSIESGPIFVRRQDLQVHLDAQGQAQFQSYRVKLLNSSALQAGNLSIAWNPAAGAPIVHNINVFRDGKAIDVLKSTSFEILRREDQLEAAKLDGMLTAVLRVPDLRVGDELEVEITTFASDPTLGPYDAGLLVLAPIPAPGNYHLGLSWDEGSKPNLKYTPDLTSAMSTSANAIDFKFENPPAVSSPKDAPMRYQWQRAIQYSDFADWASMSRHFAPVYVKAAKIGADSPIKAEARRIASANASPLDRATAALKLVQENVRYIYVGLNGGNLTPASAEETWQRRYGDCKGKTVLLMALLAELGIDAEPVLINSSGMDDGLDQRLPLPQFFDHVLVRAHIDGKAYWLDGTMPSVAPPSLKPLFSFNYDLPITSGGSALEKLKWEPAATPDEVNLFEVDARAGFDKPARIVSTKILRGVEGIKQQLQLSSASPAQLLEAFRQNAVGDVWQAIDDVKWRYDPKAGASILTISGIGIVKWDDDGNGARSLALAGGGFSPPESRVRTADANRDAPFYSKPEYTCHVTTVRFPDTTRPEQWSAKPGFDTRIFGRSYHRAWDMRDGAIRMVRGSRVEQTEIDAATAQRDNARIAAFDNSMGYIFYKPAGRAPGVGTGTKVPATYELDWTAADVPCATPLSSN